jgi:hypothetical protein
MNDTLLNMLQQLIKDWGDSKLLYLYSAIHLGDKYLILMNCTRMVEQARYTLIMRLHCHKTRLRKQSTSLHVVYKPKVLATLHHPPHLSLVAPLLVTPISI